MRTLDTIQWNRQKLNFQSHPKPKKQFVCLYGKNYYIYISITSIYLYLCLITYKDLCCVEGKGESEGEGKRLIAYIY